MSLVDSSPRQEASERPRTPGKIVPEFWVNIFFALLACALPLGTRLLWHAGDLFGAAIEPGTASLYATQLLALGGALALAIRDRRNWRLAWSSWVVRAGAALALAALLSAVVSDNPGDSLLHAGWFTLGWLLLVVAKTSKLAPESLAAGFMAGGVLQALLAIVQVTRQYVGESTLLGVAEHWPEIAGTAVVETASGRFLRAYGTFPHPNVLGLYMAVGLLCAFGFEMAWHKRFRSAMRSCVPLLVVGLVLSFSRAAWLAAGLGVAIFLVASRRRNAGPLKDWAWLAAPAIALSLLGLLLPFVALRSQLLSRAHVAGNRLETRSVDERKRSLEDGLRVFARHPLLGSGIGRMPYAAAALVVPRRQSGWEYQNAHAVPAMALAETGLVGLVALLSLGVAAGLGLWRSRRRWLAEPRLIGLAAAGAAMLAASVFDHFLWSLWPGVLFFWLLVAGIATIDRTGNLGMLPATDETQT